MFGSKRSASNDSTPSRSAQEEAELKERLTPEQWQVTQKAGTERAFSGCYWDTKTPGVYSCVVCETELFESDTKYDSGTGWPSFSRAIADGAVTEKTDRTMGMSRIEALCANCGAHLGHVFPDGPAPSGLRYCMNSASLHLEVADQE